MPQVAVALNRATVAGMQRLAPSTARLVPDFDHLNSGAAGPADHVGGATPARERDDKGGGAPHQASAGSGLVPLCGRAPPSSPCTRWTARRDPWPILLPLCRRRSL